MTVKNNNIVQYYEKLVKSFNNQNKYFPAKIIFIIHKNICLLESLAQEIYLVRDGIVQHYGILDNEQEETYIIPEAVQKKAQKELNELLQLEQDIQILKLKFKDIENLEFTSNQMEAIMFMIEEENDEDQVE